MNRWKARNEKETKRQRRASQAEGMERAKALRQRISVQGAPVAAGGRQGPQEVWRLHDPGGAWAVGQGSSSCNARTPVIHTDI